MVRNSKTSSNAAKRNMTLLEIAGELELHETAVRRYIREGCPASKRKGMWYLAREEVAAWMAEQNRSGKVGRPTQSVSEEIKAEQLRVLRARADKAEMELEESRHRLLPAEDVEASNIRKILTVKAGLLGLPPAIAPQLAGLGVPEIQQRLEQEFTRLLEEFARK